QRGHRHRKRRQLRRDRGAAGVVGLAGPAGRLHGVAIRDPGRADHGAPGLQLDTMPGRRAVRAAPGTVRRGGRDPWYAGADVPSPVAVAAGRRPGRERSHGSASAAQTGREDPGRRILRATHRGSCRRFRGRARRSAAHVHGSRPRERARSAGCGHLAADRHRRAVDRRVEGFAAALISLADARTRYPEAGGRAHNVTDRPGSAHWGRSMGDLVPAADASGVVDWIHQALVEEYNVRSLVPEVFEDYARIFHPAMDVDQRPVSWAAVARWSGRVMHSRAQWDPIANPVDPELPPPFTEEPESGSLPRAQAKRLAEILQPYTERPERCWFAVWDGSDFRRDWARGPRFTLPLGRELILLSGSLEAVTTSMNNSPEDIFYQSPYA